MPRHFGSSFSAYLSAQGTVPDELKGVPWFEDGNVLLTACRVVFKFYTGLLMTYSVKLAERIENMSDDSVVVVDGCPVLELDCDAANLACFLTAIVDNSDLYLNERKDFITISGILRVAALYDSPTLRSRATRALEARYPRTFDAWRAEHAETSFICSHRAVIDLARETGAFSVLPAAHAYLAAEASLREVYGLRTRTRTRTCTSTCSAAAMVMPRLNAHDELLFALVKAHDHACVSHVIDLLDAMRDRGCTKPPAGTLRNAGMAPVGSKTLVVCASLCEGGLEEVGRTVLRALAAPDPPAFCNFVEAVRRVMRARSDVCEECVGAVEEGLRERCEEWWDGLPRVLGFGGWCDDRFVYS